MMARSPSIRARESLRASFMADPCRGIPFPAVATQPRTGNPHVDPRASLPPTPGPGGSCRSMGGGGGHGLGTGADREDRLVAEAEALGEVARPHAGGAQRSYGQVAAG